jgi:hypothetical protein
LRSSASTLRCSWSLSPLVAAGSIGWFSSDMDKPQA